MSNSPILPFPELLEPCPTVAPSLSGADAARRRPARTGLKPRPLVPESLDQALQLGRAVVAARLTPRGLESAEACMIAILHGMEVGLSPMQALQRIAVVNRRPTIWGDGALALVQASGLAQRISETIEGEGPTYWVGVCEVVRQGSPLPVVRRFSVEDARRARLWGKAGPWSEYPQRMLQMRARAFALRDAFADVLGGLYLREEIEDDETGPGIGFTRAADRLVETASARAASTAHSAGPAPAAAIITPVEPKPRSERRRAPPPPPQLPPDPASPATVAQVCEVPSPVETAGAVPQSLSTPPVAGGPDTVTAKKTSRGIKVDLTDQRQPTGPRPRLTNRRLRSGVGEAARRRFEQHWDIRRPRTLGERRVVLGKGRGASAPARRTAGDASIQERYPSPASITDGQTTADEQQKGYQPNPDGEQTLTLFDDALCCAFDAATLAEIVEEFALRLEQLESALRARAAQIQARHVDRFERLDRPARNPGDPA